MTDNDYNECVQRHADALYRFIVKNIRNTADSEDIVQSAFEKLWIKRKSVNAANSKSYLFTVGYHELIDTVRKKQKMVWQEEGYLYSQASDHKKLLEMAFSRLTQLQRSLILLKDYEGYSYEEIGEITGLTAAQVSVYLHRARIQVRKFIGSLGNELYF